MARGRKPLEFNCESALFDVLREAAPHGLHLRTIAKMRLGWNKGVIATALWRMKNQNIIVRSGRRAGSRYMLPPIAYNPRT